ncbi:MAG: hypothetical protein COS85_16290 [Armatimonadetes bacterium CG07_land_8_20_14_0_80_59_28]|nr:MAG: hypothetical protein COS85_16290 [Armatimonadetes bacterium CG07_land_8_20_14_0_80_59_28]PIX39014.1 MAG: hypothetical protein COZ56_18900 [Armatimonadetes bacterium CG_4_8_14_3_um_filter_58_9]PJB74344.1 MAG: hypothetical protein CO095_04885 [Armatimonadetes bacterium CG_4_9_14_3_um_filter_58_7]
MRCCCRSAKQMDLLRGRMPRVFGALALFTLASIASAILSAPYANASLLEDIRFLVGGDGTRLVFVDRTRHKLTETAKPPIIDGRLDDDCWQVVSAGLGKFQLGLSPTLAQHSREAWASFDTENLYLAVRLQRKTGQELRALTRESDNPKIWEDDEVEIFLDPFGTGSAYYQIIVNSEGDVYDATHLLKVVPDPAGTGPADTKIVRDTDTSWSSNLIRKTGIYEDHWFVEMALPLNSIGLQGAPAGHEVRFNITSADWDTNEYTTLNPVSDWHDPVQFGGILLGSPLIIVEQFLLESVGAGMNAAALRVKAAGEALTGCFIDFSFRTPSAAIGKRTGLKLTSSESSETLIPFTVVESDQPWDAQIRIVNSAGQALFASRRAGVLPPLLAVDLGSRAAFTDGSPVKVTARTGVGRLALRESALTAVLRDPNGKVVDEQLIAPLKGGVMAARMSIENLAPGQHTLQVRLRDATLEVATAEQSFWVGASPFAPLNAKISGGTQ